MIRPNGTCAPIDFGYGLVSIGENNCEYLYFVFPLPFQPIHWQSGLGSAREKMRLELNRQIYLSGVNPEFHQNWYLLGDQNIFAEKSVVIADLLNVNHEWQTAKRIDKIWGQPFLASDGPSLAADARDYPHYVLGCVEIWKDGAGDIEFDGLQIATCCDLEYDDPLPAGALYAEKICRTTASKLLYGSQRPQSSHLLVEGTCHTINNLGYEARWIMSWPLFGKGNFT